MKCVVPKTFSFECYATPVLAPPLQGRIHPLLPYGIMGANALIAGIVCLTGPETTNQPTQEIVVRKQSAKGRAKESVLYDDKEALFESTV